MGQVWWHAPVITALWEIEAKELDLSPEWTINNLVKH